MTLKEKILNRKLNKIVNQLNEFVYKLPFIKNSNQYDTKIRVDGNTIYADVFVTCVNNYQEMECYEQWKKYNYRIKFSLLFKVYVYLNIVQKHENKKGESL